VLALSGPSIVADVDSSSSSPAGDMPARNLKARSRVSCTNDDPVALRHRGGLDFTEMPRLEGLIQSATATKSFFSSDFRNLGLSFTVMLVSVGHPDPALHIANADDLGSPAKNLISFTECLIEAIAVGLPSFVD
jgi:hypothetical protein